MADSSDFVKELINEHEVELNEFAITDNQVFIEQINCLVCETGTLKARSGNFGRFYSCSHFPRCSHKERACKKCQSVMTKKRYAGFKACLNDSCNTLLPICNECGAEMVSREGKNGVFWACRNYKGNEKQSCKNTIDSSKIKWPEVQTLQ